METNMDGSDVLETTENVAEETTIETPEAEVEAETPQTDAEKEQLKSRLEELEKKNKQLYERAKKAESSSKKDNDGLSNKDVLFLAKATIHEDDVDSLVTFARKMGMDMASAYQEYKPILDVKAEQRRTASATQTRGGRGSAKVTGEDLLQKAEKTGEIPETDDGMRAIAEARLARRMAHIKR